MKIEVTPELIARYHQGKCTHEENEAVMEWLLDPESAEELQLPEGESDVTHKAIIWKGISKGMRTKTVLLFPIPIFSTETVPLHSYYRLAIAICLVLGVIVSGNFYLKNLTKTTVELDNWNSDKAKITQVANLSFTLSPKSTVETNTSFWSQATQIRFCGTLEVTNNSEKDVELTFHSDCQKTMYTSQKVKVAKGKSYVAMHYHLNTDEIIVVDKARIQDLPPFLLTQIIKDFKI